MPLMLVNWRCTGVLDEERWELGRRHSVMVMGKVAEWPEVMWYWGVDDVDIRRWVML